MEKIGKKLKEREEELAREDMAEAGGTESIQDLITRYKNLLVGGLILIALIIIGGFGWNYFQGKQNTEANEAMFMAVNYFESKDFNSALDGDSLNNYGFLDIINEYGSTDAGNLAKYYVGVIYLEQGNNAGGIDYLEDFSKGENMLSVSAYMALGFAYEDEGDFEAAASNFKKAATAVGANKHTTPLALLHAGISYEQAGELEKALDLYKEIKEDYPTSTEGQSIDKYIGRASQ